MSSSTLSGPLTSTSGFIGALTGNVGNTTSSEIAARNDDSAMIETLIAAGAAGVAISETSLALVGAGAITLAAPTKPAFRKHIAMTIDNGDVTLALTNVVGGTQATTATFGAVGQVLILESNLAIGKWVVVKEHGVVLS